jgi:hypothetical protein
VMLLTRLREGQADLRRVVRRAGLASPGRPPKCCLAASATDRRLRVRGGLKTRPPITIHV